MKVAGLIEALQKLDPEATAVVHVPGGAYMYPVDTVQAKKAICWAEGGNDPGLVEEGDAAGAYDVVYIGALAN